MKLTGNFTTSANQIRDNSFHAIAIKEATCIMFLCVITIFFLQFARVEVEQFVIQLRPDQILSTFQSVVSPEFLHNIANDFAKKAAEHLINEMKLQGKHLFMERTEGKPTGLDSKLVNKAEVMSLLREPLPDGDNLEVEMLLSDEEGVNSTKDRGPIIPMKINGAYFKRSNLFKH